MRLTLVYVRTNAFRNVQARAKSSAAFDSRAGRCTARETKFVFYTREVKCKIFFFTNSKLRFHNKCVLNFISAACVKRIKISNCL